MTSPDLELAALRALLPLSTTAAARWAMMRIDQLAQRIAQRQPSDRGLAECRVKLEEGIVTVQRRRALPIHVTFPENLPVSARRDEIVALLGRCSSFVLTGETGSGKTTQLPKMLLEAGYGRRGLIALTQPRRVAALSMARRLREELSAGPGVVAHSVRFDDQSTPDTLIRVMTDGLLLAEAAIDPDMSRYDAIIVDEAHERSLNIDLLLGLLKRLRQRRPELVVLVASASIEAERFAAYLGDDTTPAPIIAVSGRTFPVEIRHRPPHDDDIGYLDATVSALREVHEELGTERGDILCFLPTERDIIDARRRLDGLPGTTILALFGRLTPNEQQRVFQTAPGRKIVLATNVAETSLTIPGIRVVVDTGLARLKRYQASTRTERLPIEAVSQASLTQRAGRAGRVEAGICLRLFGADDAAARDPFTAPEILRSNLAGVLLTCLHLGLGDPELLSWLDPPSPHAWRQARELVDELGALSEKKNIAGQRTLSSLGHRLAGIPADPQVARILLAGVDEGVAHEACTIAAFLSIQDPRVRPMGQESAADSAHRSFAHEAGDIASVLRLWDRWQSATSNSTKSRLCTQLFLGFRRMREWADVRHQLWQALRDRRSDKPLPNVSHPADAWPLDRVHRAVLSGMLGHVLMYDPDEHAYRGAANRLLHVHPGSALRSGKSDDRKKAPPPPPWLVACEVVETSRLFARLCAPIDPQWVLDLAGDRVKRSYRDPHWHPRRHQVVCKESVTWKGLPVREGRLIPYERVDAADATRIFIREALCGTDDLDRHFPVLARNRRILDDAKRLRHRLRDPSLFVDDHLLETFYAERLRGTDTTISHPVASSDGLRYWLNHHGSHRLNLEAADLAAPELVARAEQFFPERVTMAGVQLRLDYHYAPGSATDGATLEINDNHLAALDPQVLDRLIPGWLPEIVTTRLEQLPKDLRRQLIPLAESALALVEVISQDHHNPLDKAFDIALAKRLGESLSIFSQRKISAVLPPHVRLRYRIRDADGRLLYEGRDPAFIATQANAAADRLQALRARYDTEPSVTWPGDCVGEVILHGVTGHVALARARNAQGLPAAQRSVYASAIAAAAWHHDGLDALLEGSLALELDTLVLSPASLLLSSRCERLLGQRIGAIRRGLAIAIMKSVERRRVVDSSTWNTHRDQVHAELRANAPQIDPLIDRICTRMESLRNRLKQGSKNLVGVLVQRSVARHMERLCGPTWLSRLPWQGLQRLDKYLDSLQRLLDDCASRSAEVQRACVRRDALLDAWDSAVDDGQRRLAEALGMGPRLKDAALEGEERLLAASNNIVGASAGIAESHWRTSLAVITRELTIATDRIAQIRCDLLDAHALSARLAPGRLRERLQSDCTRMIKDFPDLGLGCDLEAQILGARALCDRVRSALATVG